MPIHMPPGPSGRHLPLRLRFVPPQGRAHRDRLPGPGRSVRTGSWVGSEWIWSRPSAGVLLHSRVFGRHCAEQLLCGDTHHCLRGRCLPSGNALVDPDTGTTGLATLRGTRGTGSTPCRLTLLPHPLRGGESASVVMCLETLQEQTLFSRERAIPELVCLVFELVVGLLCSEQRLCCEGTDAPMTEGASCWRKHSSFAAVQGLEAVTDRLVGGVPSPS